MDEPLMFEDTEGNQYIEVSWLIERLRNIHHINAFNNLGIESILDLIDEIEIYAEQNF